MNTPTLRTHDRLGFCAVCGADVAVVGSACVVSRLPSARHRLFAVARRQEVLRVARNVTAEGPDGRELVIEAVHVGHRDGALHLEMYAYRERAEEMHGRDNLILTGLENERTEAQR
jgi:hypothetical protein